jgi:hypothetical protein
MQSKCMVTIPSTLTSRPVKSHSFRNWSTINVFSFFFSITSIHREDFQDFQLRLRVMTYFGYSNSNSISNVSNSLDSRWSSIIKLKWIELNLKRISSICRVFHLSNKGKPIRKCLVWFSIHWKSLRIFITAAVVAKISENMILFSGSCFYLDHFYIMAAIWSNMSDTYTWKASTRYLQWCIWSFHSYDWWIFIVLHIMSGFIYYFLILSV